MRSHIILIHCILLISFSCRKTETPAREFVLNETLAACDSVRYAKGFVIETHDDYTIVTIRNPWKPESTLQRYALVPKAAALPKNLPEGVIIRTPLARTVCYGSVHCSFFAQFDALQTLVGVCEPQYINIPAVQQGIADGNIDNLGQSANPDIEKIIEIEPEAIFASPIEGYTYGQATKLGIPFIECTDYMETTPLGRSEWIRLLGLFFDKRTLADSLFRETESRYNELNTIAQQVEIRPTVMAETVYNGVWYMPGGNSYMSCLFRDAGADYVWKDDKNAGSLSLSFEMALEQAGDADFWLIKYNSPEELTAEKLLHDYPNYAFFKAFVQRNIYAVNTGKTPYYEELPIHPDRVLKDLVRIFHPELLKDYEMRYYSKMADTTVL